MDADPRDALIQELQAENAELRDEAERLRELIKQLTARLEEWQREAHRQAAPFRRKDKDKKASR
ncbi:MAG: hypothetical protein JXB13_06080 [Phycisphaerae bacterium]|nr:hypothetical protein [Phycisphaerae bacterium]